MSEEAEPRPAIPGNITAIGVLQIVGGLQSLGLAVAWVLGGISIASATFGLGLPACCLPFVFVGLAAAEFYSGIKHLSSDHRGLRAPTGVAIAEACTLVCCAPITGASGVITLVLLRDPGVQSYYAARQIETK